MCIPSSFPFASFLGVACPAHRPLVISPGPLLACIFLLPAAVAFVVVSHVFKSQDDDDTEFEAAEDTNWSPVPRSITDSVQIEVPYGLGESVIEMIPVAKYSLTEGVSESSACVVCLCSFEEAEAIKMLPPCSHSFHVPCIDKWLESHSTCPLCRSKIKVQAVETPPAISQETNNPQPSSTMLPTADSDSNFWGTSEGSQKQETDPALQIGFPDCELGLWTSQSRQNHD